MSVSIKKEFNYMTAQGQIEMNRVMNAILTDSAALRAAIVGITAQLDGDTGITDTDYAATNDPAALTLIA